MVFEIILYCLHSNLCCPLIRKHEYSCRNATKSNTPDTILFCYLKTRSAARCQQILMSFRKRSLDNGTYCMDYISIKKDRNAACYYYAFLSSLIFSLYSIDLLFIFYRSSLYILLIFSLYSIDILFIFC